MRQSNRLVHDTPAPLRTTLAELTSAFFEVAFAECGDERLAERITVRWVLDAMRSGRFLVAAH